MEYREYFRAYRTNPQIVIHAIKHLCPLELSLIHDIKESELSIELDDCNVTDDVKMLRILSSISILRVLRLKNLYL